MNLCSSTALANCTGKNVPRKLEKKLQRCNYEGHLTSDPDSVVNLLGLGCDDEPLGVTIISSRANLSQNIYRRLPTGEIEVPKIETFEKKVSSSSKRRANDYANFEHEGHSADTETDLSYVDENGDVISMIRDKSLKKCCRPVKMECMGKKREDTKCKVKKGKACCGGSSKCSCEDLRTHILKMKRKQRKLNKRKRKEKPVMKNGKVKGGRKGRGRKKEKKLHSLTKGDLKSLLRTLEVQSRKPNPKCMRKKEAHVSTFRDKKYIESHPIILNCVQPCRKKDPIPRKRKYKQRTLELGLFTDKAIYNQMAVRIFPFRFNKFSLLNFLENQEYQQRVNHKNSNS